MKEYQGKTAEEALANAAEELNVPVDSLIYIVSDKRKGLFSKKVVVEVFEIRDVVMYAEDYILDVIDSLDIESSVQTTVDQDIIRICIDSEHNPVLIGKNGRTLQALNELTKLAVSNHFHRRFRILLDINGYKDSKYSRLARVARRAAHDVQRSHDTYTFEPMPPDERRAIHNACSNMSNIKTESVGEGLHRQVQIIYVE